VNSVPVKGLQVKGENQFESLLFLLFLHQHHLTSQHQHTPSSHQHGFHAEVPRLAPELLPLKGPPRLPIPLGARLPHPLLPPHSIHPAPRQTCLPLQRRCRRHPRRRCRPHPGQLDPHFLPQEDRTEDYPLGARDSRHLFHRSFHRCRSAHASGRWKQCAMHLETDLWG